MVPAQEARTVIADGHGSIAVLDAEDDVDEPGIENAEKTLDGDDHNHTASFVRSAARCMRLFLDGIANIENPPQGNSIADDRHNRRDNAAEN